MDLKIHIRHIFYRPPPRDTLATSESRLRKLRDLSIERLGSISIGRPYANRFRVSSSYNAIPRSVINRSQEFSCASNSHCSPFLRYPLQSIRSYPVPSCRSISVFLPFCLLSPPSTALNYGSRIRIFHCSSYSSFIHRLLLGPFQIFPSESRSVPRYY